jgi:hypothetical protein
MSSLRVLITNLAVRHSSGTETYVRDLAAGLTRLGHRPIIYTTIPGELAEEIAATGTAVVDDLTRLRQPPDVIHGNHHHETMTALLHFPGVPGIFFCHDRVAWHDTPPLFPRLRRYVAVDDTCAERFELTPGLDPECVRVLLHGVDLARFRPRPPLPGVPRRALVFSHQASEATHLPAARQACSGLGIALDVAGAAAGTGAARPERLLGDYDLVFAKARCAQEALAVGTAVVLCDANGAGEMVRTDNWERLRRVNFGRRALSRPVSAEALAQEVARYDAADAHEVARRFRAVADLDRVLGDVVALYREAIDEQSRLSPPDLRDEERAAAAYLRHVSPKKILDAWHLRAQQAEHEQRHWQERAGELERELARARSEADALRRRPGWVWVLSRVRTRLGLFGTQEG